MARWWTGLLKSVVLTGLCTALTAALPGDAGSQSQTVPAGVSPSGISSSIGGRVTDTVTGGGISNVKVVARTGQLFFNAMTDADGRYALQGLPPSTYALRFSRSVAYEFEPNPFPDLNYTPAPLIVELKEGRNVVDADLRVFYWGTKIPSIMMCGSQPCGHKVTVFDFDDPATATDPHCGTAACDGPEDFNKAPTNRVHRIVQKGFSSSETFANPRGFTYVTSFEYNDNGAVARIDGPRRDAADWIEYEYFPSSDQNPNNRGKLHKIRRWTTPATFLETTFESYHENGRPQLERYPNGNTIAFAFDDFGRITRETNIDGSHTDFHYANDRLLYVRRQNGSFVNFYFSGEDPKRVSHVIISPYPSVDGTEVSGHRFQMSCDADGGDCFLTAHGVRGDVAYARRYEGNSRNERFSKDYLNTYSYEEHEYDRFRNIVNTKGPTGTEILFRRDAFGERIAVEASVDAKRRAITEYLFDAWRNLVGMTDPLGRHTSYVYDDMARLIFVESPDSGSTKYWYNEASLLSGRTDARGVTVKFEYDGQGRIMRARVPHGSDLPVGVVETADIEYFYDENGNLGFLTSVFDDSGYTRFSYSLRGRMVSVATYRLGLDTVPRFNERAVSCFGNDRYQVVSDPRSYSNFRQLVSGALECTDLLAETALEYNDFMNTTRIRYPSGRTVEYDYCTDPEVCGLGRPTAVRATGTRPYEGGVAVDQPELWPFQEVLRFNSFSPIGQPEDFDVIGEHGTYTPRGINVRYVFDIDGRVAKFWARKKECSDPAEQCQLFDRIYNYDPSNRITSVADSGYFKYSVDVGYNASGWTTAATYFYGGRHQEHHTSFWTYDEMGNRLVDEYGEYSRDLNGRSLSKRATGREDAISLTYDGAGNVASFRGTQNGQQYGIGYGRDAFGRVVFLDILEPVGARVFVRLFRDVSSRVVSRFVISPDLDFRYWTVFGYLNGGRLLWKLGVSESEDFIWAHSRIPVAFGENRTGYLRPILRPLEKDLVQYTGLCNTQLDLFGYAIPDGEPAGTTRGQWGEYCTRGGFPGQWQMLHQHLLDNGHRTYHAFLGQYLEPDPWPFAAKVSDLDVSYDVDDRTGRYLYARNSPLVNADMSGMYTCGEGCMTKRQCDPLELCQDGRTERCVERAKPTSGQGGGISDDYEYLRDCVVKACKTATIKCNQGECCTNPALQGAASDPAKKPREIVICQHNVFNCILQTKDTMTDTVIHEFAHHCKLDNPDVNPNAPYWDHDGGLAGVPYGEPKSKEDTCQPKCLCPMRCQCNPRVHRHTQPHERLRSRL